MTRHPYSWLFLAVLLIGLLTSFTHAASVPPTFDQDRTYRDLVKQCSFGPRVPGTASHIECMHWLAMTLYHCADEVQIQQFTAQIGDQTLPLMNIIATFNPKGKSHVLLAAHWDSRPIADHDPDPAKQNDPIPGANDGASGVAVLLEIARALKAAPPQQRVTIVLFDGEDFGRTHESMFLGSTHFARTYKGPKVAWGVLLDMVGDTDLRLPVEGVSQQQAPVVVERVWLAAEQAGSTAFVRETGPSVYDDHIPLLRAGMPCIDVIDFSYPYWHTVADTPDKCSAASLGQVGRALLGALTRR